jgi:uncharacterized phage protein (TIGR02218 family)
MKVTDPAFPNWLKTTTAFWYADLYTWTLADRDIPIMGTSWPGGISPDWQNVWIISTSSMKYSCDLSVDSVKVTIALPADGLCPSGNSSAYLRAGYFDGARLLVQRLFMAAPGLAFDSPDNPVPLFSGRVSNVQLDGTKAEIEVKSDLELLNIQLPRNLYGPQCRWTLFDGQCGLNINDPNYQVSGTVVSATATHIVVSNIGGKPDHWFDQGQLTVKAGLSTNVKTQVGTDIDVFPPFVVVPQPGDTYTLLPGCDKTLATCESKFNNRLRFGGTPFVPKPETAY